MKKFSTLLLVFLLSFSIVLGLASCKDETDGSENGGGNTNGESGDGNKDDGTDGENGDGNKDDGTDGDGGNSGNGGSTAQKPSKGLEYDTDWGGYFVSVGSCTDSKIVIPETYNGLPVIGISNFSDCDFITSITIPKSVFYVAQNAFDGCTKLIVEKGGVHYVNNWVVGSDDDITEAVIRPGTVGISSGAFANRTNLVNVDIPDSALHVIADAFRGCDALTENQSGISYVDNWVIGGITLNDGTLTLRDGTVGIATDVILAGAEIIIPDSVKTIGSMISTDYSLPGFDTECKRISIGSGVSYIESYAFCDIDTLTEISVSEENKNYKSIDGNLYTKDGRTFIQYALGRTDTEFTLPLSVTEILDSSFPGCKNLTGIVIGGNVTRIGKYAFTNCPNLSEITVDEANAAYKSIGGNLYTKDERTLIRYAEAKTDNSFTVPDAVTHIEAYAFYDCDNLVSITSGSSVTHVGDYAFADCGNLSYISNADSVISIGNGVFAGCNSLTNIIIPDRVTTIGDHAFMFCSSLGRVTIGADVASLGKNVFSGCYVLSEITVNEANAAYKSIGGNLYTKNGRTLIRYAPAKTDDSFTVPDSVTHIEAYAFYDCGNLVSITLGSSVTHVGDYAFAYCYELKSVEIGDSVTHIGDYAFYECRSIEKVTLSERNANFTVIDGDLYTKDGKTLIIDVTSSTPENPVGPPPIGPGTDDDDDWWKNIKYDETELTMMMTNCSNNQVLSSGCERYLAGEGFEVTGASIDKLVADRNSNAYENTKVKVTYDYYPDNADLYGFSRMYDVIETEIMSAASAPDIYCNWMTDLHIASLKGCFANLYSINYGTGDYRGNNHFNFAEDGYMADLMGSLTLSINKIYVVASDYFIDLIRSFYVVPVNVSLFGEVAAQMYPHHADPSISALFDETKPCDCANYDESTRCTYDCPSGGWTYDRLIEFSQAVFSLNGDNATEDCNGYLGFALGSASYYNNTNNIHARALVYSSSVSLINKLWNASGGKYDYTYPNENQELYGLFTKISEMMDTDGIYNLTNTDAQTLGENNYLLGIRHKFVNNTLLFGGITLLANLEYDDYQNMNADGNTGFAILPVPVYRSGDMYNTQIHITGKAGAIRYNTSKYVQCSAFLHYQSTNSFAVTEEYYDSITFGNNIVTNDVYEGSFEMLHFIRQNVRTSFDVLFEDAIGFMYADVDKDSVNNRYHALLADHGYQYANIASKYDDLQPVKFDALKNLEQDYSKLPL